MNQKWFRNSRDDQDKERLKRELEASKLLFEKLEEILKDELANLQKELASEETFDKPAWAEWTAFNLGRQKQIYSVLNLIPNYGDN